MKSAVPFTATCFKVFSCPDFAILLFEIFLDSFILVGDSAEHIWKLFFVSISFSGWDSNPLDSDIQGNDCSIKCSSSLINEINGSFTFEIGHMVTLPFAEFKTLTHFRFKNNLVKTKITKLFPEHQNAQFSLD